MPRNPKVPGPPEDLWAQCYGNSISFSTRNQPAPMPNLQEMHSVGAGGVGWALGNRCSSHVAEASGWRTPGQHHGRRAQHGPVRKRGHA